MRLDHPDPEDHPDLRAIDDDIARQFEEILAAEHHAARIAAQRRTAMRDLLVRAEDMCATIEVTTAGGVLAGPVTAVGTDHLVLGGRTTRIVAIAHIVAFEITT